MECRLVLSSLDRPYVSPAFPLWPVICRLCSSASRRAASGSTSLVVHRDVRQRHGNVASHLSLNLFFFLHGLIVPRPQSRWYPFPNRDTVSVAERQETLHKKIFGVARILGSGHIDFDTLVELVLATVPDCSRKRTRLVSSAG
jgi:hypothetical protein